MPAPGGIRLSDPSDSFEQAAERSAEQAMSQPAPVGRTSAETGVQRQGEEEEEETAQTAQTLVAQRQEEEEEEEQG